MFKNYMLVLPLTLSEMGTIQTSQSHVKKLACPKVYLALGTWYLKMLVAPFLPTWPTAPCSPRMRCHKPLKVPISTYKFNSRSRPSDNGGGGVSGHPDPEIGRGWSQNFFSPFGPQFGLKIRVGRGGGPSLDPPLKFSRLISIHFLHLIKHQSISSLVIILSILITFPLPHVLFLLGENWCWALLGLSANHSFTLDKFISHMGNQPCSQGSLLLTTLHHLITLWKVIQDSIQTGFLAVYLGFQVLDSRFFVSWNSGF